MTSTLDDRLSELQSWLKKDCHLSWKHFVSLKGDASFRRYFRLYQDERSLIAVDAPPQTENCLSFVAIAQSLRNLQLNVPEVMASDLEKGFLLLTDFGDELLLKVLTSANARPLYMKSLEALSLLQTCQTVKGWAIPIFNDQWMLQELHGFSDWFLKQYLHVPQQKIVELGPFFSWLVNKASAQPYVFSHRDYHSANLMLLPQQTIGILDFQDAFMGPVTYDVVSLLRDCYIDWPPAFVKEMALFYLSCAQEGQNLLGTSADEFIFWLDIMGIQRHLKALMTFTRKHIRDHQSQYLQYVPRTLNYLLNVSDRYEECQGLSHFIRQLDKISELLCVP